MGVGSASGNTFFGIGLGALFGVFIGWFVAAALENRKKNKLPGKQPVCRDLSA